MSITSLNVAWRRRHFKYFNEHIMLSRNAETTSHAKASGWDKYQDFQTRLHDFRQEWSSVRGDFVLTHFVHIVDLSLKCNVNSSWTSGEGLMRPSFGRGGADTKNVFLYCKICLWGGRGQGDHPTEYFFRFYWPIFIQFYTRCNHPLPENVWF